MLAPDVSLAPPENPILTPEPALMSHPNLTPEQTTALEAAVFRRLLTHLDERKDVQNIDLMNLAGFCRNCLSKWYAAAAVEAGVVYDYEQARTRVYGMPYTEWKANYQQDASPEQLQAMADSQAKPH